MKKISLLFLSLCLMSLCTGCTTQKASPQDVIDTSTTGEETYNQTEMKTIKSVPMQTIAMGPVIADIDAQRRVQKYVFSKDNTNYVRVDIRPVEPKEIETYKKNNKNSIATYNTNNIEISTIPCDVYACIYAQQGQKTYALTRTLDAHTTHTTDRQDVSDLVESFQNSLRFDDDASSAQKNTPDAYTYIDALRTGTKNDHFNTQDIEIIKQNLETIQKTYTIPTNTDETFSLTQNNVTVVYTPSTETIQTAFDPQRKTHTNDTLAVIKNGKLQTYPLPYTAANKKFAAASNPEDITQRALITKTSNISPSGYYLVYTLGVFECSTTEILDLDTGKKVAEFPGTLFTVWTNNKKQLVLGGSAGMCQEGGLFITKEKSFPETYKISDDRVEALYVDNRYIYVLTTSQKDESQHIVKIYNMQSLEQIY